MKIKPTQNVDYPTWYNDEIFAFIEGHKYLFIVSVIRFQIYAASKDRNIDLSRQLWRTRTKIPFRATCMIYTRR